MIVAAAAVAGLLLGILLGRWLIPWRTGWAYYSRGYSDGHALAESILDWEWPPSPTYYEIRNDEIVERRR